MSYSWVERMSERINIKNRRAYFDYEILDKFEAGIMLTGTEVKSIRDGKASIAEAYCYITSKGELLIRNMHIAEYTQGSHNNHDTTRLRKLLLHKREIEKIQNKVKEKTMTIIPLRVYLNDRGIAKMEIGVGRGKKTFDKRDSIKAKENKRNLDRVLKRFR